MGPHSEQGEEWAHALLHPTQVEPARRRLAQTRARLAGCITTLFEGPDEGRWGDGAGKEACSDNQWAVRRALAALRQTWRALGRREDENLAPPSSMHTSNVKNAGHKYSRGTGWRPGTHPDQFMSNVAIPNCYRTSPHGITWIRIQGQPFWNCHPCRWMHQRARLI